MGQDSRQCSKVFKSDGLRWNPRQVGLPTASCVSPEECPLTAPIGLLKQNRLWCPRPQWVSWARSFPSVVQKYLISLVHFPNSLVGVVLSLRRLRLIVLKSCLCFFELLSWKWIGTLQSKSVCSGSQGNWAPTFPICLLNAAKAWLIMKDGTAIAWNSGVWSAAACTSGVTPGNGWNTHSCPAGASPSWRWSQEGESLCSLKTVF